MNAQTIEFLYKVGSVIGGLGVLILGIFQLFVRPRLPKTQDSLNVAEAAKTIVDATIEGFENRVKQLENDLAKERSARAQLEKEVQKERDERQKLQEEIKWERLAREKVEAANKELMQKFMLAEARNHELSNEIKVLRARLDAIPKR